jgi:hypothetical protein
MEDCLPGEMLEKVKGRREKGEGRREKGEGRREKGEDAARAAKSLTVKTYGTAPSRK